MEIEPVSDSRSESDTETADIVGREVAESGSSSIVSDEPYRYACEECGSVSVRRIGHESHEPGKTFTSGGAGNVEAEQSRAENFRCKICRHRSETVYDKKLESRVAP